MFKKNEIRDTENRNTVKCKTDKIRKMTKVKTIKMCAIKVLAKVNKTSSLLLRHFLTKSNFIWQLDVSGFCN